MDDLVRARSPGAKGFFGRNGFSVLELLVVLAVLAILLTIGAIRTPSRAAQVYANDVRAALQQGRFEAIKRNQPIAVVWNVDERAWETVLGPDGDPPCNGGTLLSSARSDEYPSVTVQPGFNPLPAPAVGNGVVWLPTGQARACDFSLLPLETIAVVSDRDIEREVMVSIAGRVTVR